MFKKILISLFLPVLLYSGHVTKNFTFDVPCIKNNVVYLKGCYLLITPFTPRIAVKPITLLLPQGQEAVSFEVTYGDPVVLDGEYYIKPFMPGGIVGNKPPDDYYTRRSSVYYTDEFFPSQVKSPKFYTHYKNGHPIFISNIYPVQFNPVSGKIRYYKNIRVSIKTVSIRGTQPVVKTTPFIKSQLKLQLDNPDAVSKLPLTMKQVDDYEYLIITTDALKDSWDTFVEFNQRRCLRTKIATIEDINENVTGDSPPDRAKNYIKQEYDAYNIVYVMLGGDDNYYTNNTPYDDAIPHKSYDGEFWDYGDDHFTDSDMANDMFYETLDGMEVEDLEWEVYAGRFAADDADELNTIITKTIKYSEEPLESAIKKAVLAGEYLWENVNGGECYGKECIVLMRGEHDINGFKTTCIPETWTFTELFERDEDWSTSDIVNAINSNVHFIHHLGHSNNTYIWKMRISDGDVADCNNTGYFIGYTQGCYPGAWDNRNISHTGSINSGHSAGDCIGEEFTVGSSSGAVAFISNTRFGLTDNGEASPDGSDGANTRFQRYFLNALFELELHYIAMMHGYSKEINKQLILADEPGPNNLPYWGGLRCAAYNTTILGDPALSLWTETPQELQPTFTLTNKGFNCDTENSYTWVALEDKDGNIIITQLTSDDGVCKIEDQVLLDYIEANPSTKIKVRIKAHNYLPFEADVDIQTGIVNDITDTYNFKSIANSIGRTVRISYTLPIKEFVNISIFNSKGALAKAVVNSSQKAGHHHETLNITNFSNGIYYCRLKTGRNQCVRKFIVTK